MDEIINKNIRISFVVPCYNVESYLQECLDSIFQCRLDENGYEIVCIDDCSPDGSYEVLKKNQSAHSNLRIIRHTENKGLGGARNTGIHEAKGQYLWFVDSDDLVNSESISELLQNCIENELDILAFNYSEVDKDGNNGVDRLVFRRTGIMKGISFVRSVFGESFVNHAGYVWRFIYKTEYLRDKSLSFPENVYWEDTVYAPKSILKAERIMSLPVIGYNYRRNNHSVSGKYHESYPAELICQMAFCAGRDLLNYADEIPDGQIAESFRKKAKTMINGFVLNLLRSTRDQRHTFYVLKEAYSVNELKKQMNGLSKLFLLPVIGPMTLSVAAYIYGLKHKEKR